MHAHCHPRARLSVGLQRICDRLNLQVVRRWLQRRATAGCCLQIACGRSVAEPFDPLAVRPDQPVFELGGRPPGVVVDRPDEQWCAGARSPRVRARGTAVRPGIVRGSGRPLAEQDSCLARHPPRVRRGGRGRGRGPDHDPASGDELGEAVAVGGGAGVGSDLPQRQPRDRRRGPRAPRRGGRVKQASYRPRPRQPPADIGGLTALRLSVRAARGLSTTGGPQRHVTRYPEPCVRFARCAMTLSQSSSCRGEASC
jgi:hypothetical protein